MLKKVFLTSLIMTSSFAILSSAQAMDRPEEKQILTVSTSQLKQGYNDRFIQEEDSFLSVSSLSSAPSFDKVDMEKIYTIPSPTNIFHVFEEIPPSWNNTQYTPSSLAFHLQLTRRPFPVIEGSDPSKGFSVDWKKLSEIQDAPVVKINGEKFSVESWGTFQNLGLDVIFTPLNNAFQANQTMGGMYSVPKRDAFGNIMHGEFEEIIGGCEVWKMTLRKINQ